MKREQDRITGPLEGIEYRMAAHHGHYADAPASLDDSLRLLAHVGDTYAHADDPNRRLCNQALLKAIYISMTTTTPGPGIGVPTTGSPTPVFRPAP